jgi:hypothetical protein
MPTSERKRKTFSLRLTRFELIHLRDLLSIRLATELSTTVSQALASGENRPIIEAKLWQTVAAACRDAGVSLDDEAPDFVCASEPVTVRPAVGVYRIAEEPDQQASEEEGGGVWMGDDENENDDEEEDTE